MTVIERDTQTALDWLGDVGGLYDGLTLLVQTIIILLPFTSFAMQEDLLRHAENDNLVSFSDFWG